MGEAPGSRAERKAHRATAGTVLHDGLPLELCVSLGQFQVLCTSQVLVYQSHAVSPFGAAQHETVLVDVEAKPGISFMLELFIGNSSVEASRLVQPCFK